jgi:hypothetical protein
MAEHEIGHLMISAMSLWLQQGGWNKPGLAAGNRRYEIRELEAVEFDTILRRLTAQNRKKPD